MSFHSVVCLPASLPSALPLTAVLPLLYDVICRPHRHIYIDKLKRLQLFYRNKYLLLIVLVRYVEKDGIPHLKAQHRPMEKY